LFYNAICRPSLRLQFWFIRASKQSAIIAFCCSGVAVQRKGAPPPFAFVPGSSSPRLLESEWPDFEMEWPISGSAKETVPAAGYEPDVCHPNIAGSFSIYWEKEQNTAPGSAISGSERKTLPELAL
jgi:hypothetical protein